MNKERIIERVKREFPDIAISIASHDALGSEYEVRCFGVERSMFRSVRRKISEINDELYPNYDVSLISILFTEKETRTHYPDMAILLDQKNPCCDPSDVFWFLNSSDSAKSNLSKKYPDNPTQYSTVAADESYALAA